jgi:hypothetical protein
MRRIRFAIPLLLAACVEEAVVPAPPVVLIKLPLATPTVIVGDPPLSVAVRVEDESGAVLAGVQVTWTAGSGGAVTPEHAASGADGVASTSFSGLVPGTITVRAEVAGATPADFTILVTAAAPSSIARSGGDGQSAVAGALLTQPLLVTVRDASGNLVPGATVTWAANGGGQISPASTHTNGSGQAAAMWFTGPVPGTQQAVATLAAGSGASVSFSATTSAGIALVATVPIPSNYGIHDQYIRDGLAFVSAWNTGLIIYDVGGGSSGGSPRNPVEISRIVTATGGVAGGAAVHNAWWYHSPSGQKRYVFVGQEGPGSIGSTSSGDIHVVDVSNLGAPVEVASYRLAGAGTHNFWVDEANEILYAAYYNGGVVALNVSGTLSGDLASREIARIQPGGTGNTYVWGVHLHSDGSLYATDMLSGFWQLRLVGSAFQVLAGGGNVPERFGSDQWVHGSYAYSGTWGSRAGRSGNALKVWSLSATGAPTLVDSVLALIGTVSDVEVSSDGQLLLFSAEGGVQAGLHIYSLADDPAQPRFLARFDVPSGLHTATFATIGGRRYVFAARNPGSPALMVFEVTSLAP